MSLKTIIIDDDQVVVILHQLSLASSGMFPEPILAMEAGEAVEFIISNASSGQKYLVFLDLNMPNMNGWEFLEKINKHAISQHVFTIIVTSSINFRDKEKAKTYKNVIEFLEKPVDAEAFRKLKFLPEISTYFNK